MPAPIVVLGPQRPAPNLRRALDAHGVRGPLALITAGWRRDEDEIRPVTDHVGREVRHLRLYHDMEALFRSDPALAAAYRERQRRVLAYKDVYRISLRAASMAVRELKKHVDADPGLYGADLDDAFSALRGVDQRLLERLDTIHAAHPTVAEPWRDHEGAAALRLRYITALHEVGAVLIAGGHVGVLRNRLRFFGLDTALHAMHQADIPIFCWSAGAMVLTERVLLFYDDPPEGHGNAEILARGYGLLPGVVFLPHARLRLALDDAERVSILARRMGRSACIGLEPGAWLDYRPDGTWADHSLPDSCFQLKRDGTIGPPELADGGAP